MLTYRPDIDGLRAVAVLSVLFYHLDHSLLPGGFIGVDVFFVISGYLITKLIAKELTDTSDFSFKRFYIRRVRRLFPAMCATFLFCLVLAAILFSPQHLSDFGRSLIYALLSVSNFYFWDSAGYFDAASHFKPLLHTWSLSVEEQFYLLWPLTLFVVTKFRGRSLVIALIITAGALSLAINHLLFDNQLLISSWFGTEDNQSTLDIHATAFYLLPFRIFEFAFGAILVFVSLGKINRVTEVALFTVGMALILYSVFYFNGTMEFPSFAALVPCLGAALIIAAGPHHQLAWLLSNRGMLGIGLISYSLYLIHWPLIVFYKYPDVVQLRPLEMLALVSGSLLLAWLMYRFIEQPFRRPSLATGKVSLAKTASNRPFLFGSSIAAIIVLGFGFNLIASNGWLWRYPPNLVKQLSYTRADYADFFWDHMHAHERPFSNNGKPKVLVIGDSMAADLVNTLVEGGAAQQLDLISIKVGENCKALFDLSDEYYQHLYGGKKDICREQHRKVMAQSELIAAADTVIIATYLLEAHFVEPLRNGANYLKSLGVDHVLLLGQKDQQSNGMAFLAKYAFSPDLVQIRTPVHPSADHINKLLQRDTQAAGYEYFNLLAQFCNADGCRRVTENGDLIIFDGTHMTQAGARYVGEQITEQAWFKRILDGSSGH